MRTGVENLNSTIGNLDQQVSSITREVGAMNWQFRSLEPAVQHMGGDVNRMSCPMRLFNLFNLMN